MLDMRNIFTIDRDKVDPNIMDLTKCKISLETLFLQELDKFIINLKNHEIDYGNSDFFWDKQRDDDYLLEKMKIIMSFYKRCKMFRQGIKAEGLFMNNIVEL
jgi:type IV secretory pathway ATPase VirB11/archaellum biosynthesis ATPase